MMGPAMPNPAEEPLSEVKATVIAGRGVRSTAAKSGGIEGGDENTSVRKPERRNLGLLQNDKTAASADVLHKGEKLVMCTDMELEVRIVMNM